HKFNLIGVEKFSNNPVIQVKQVVTIEQRKVVRLLSKGTCHFQFAMKQRIDLKEDPITMGKEIMID
ncbi:hypothetical protein ANCCAN_29982, partial [Ancylostoma caninum]